jgi:hypothetical protein
VGGILDEASDTRGERAPERAEENRRRGVDEEIEIQPLALRHQPTNAAFRHYVWLGRRNGRFDDGRRPARVGYDAPVGASLAAIRIPLT